MAMNKEKRRASQRAYRRRHKEKFRTRRVWIKEHYGITPEQYKEMLYFQDYKCRICLREHVDTKYKKLTVDHDHKTEKVRALLCRQCNIMLGMAKDQVDTLRKAAEYIEAYNE